MMTLLRKALGAVPLSVWIALAMAMFAAWQWLDRSHLSAELQAVRADLTDELARNVSLEAANEWQRQQLDKMREADEQHEQRMAQDKADIQDKRAQLDQLAKPGADTTAWADERVPADIRDWVRKLADPATATAGADAHGTGVSAGTIAGAEAQGREHP